MDGMYLVKIISPLNQLVLKQILSLTSLTFQFSRLLFNNFCSLLGYYAAAKVIDRESVGRVRLQMFSFFMCAALFFITSIIFDSAQSGVIMFLFFASSFFGNFGANVTTYVMAAETYPTELRSTCHGISAFAGKTGALLATIAFGFLDTKKIFAVTASTCSPASSIRPGCWRSARCIR